MDKPGCGPESWKKFFRPPRHVFFESSCALHDEGYENKKNGGIIRKIECDVKFYGAMLGDVNEHSVNKFVDFMWATAYFLMVSALGWMFFDWVWKKRLRAAYYKYKNKNNHGQ